MYRLQKKRKKKRSRSEFGCQRSQTKGSRLDIFARCCKTFRLSVANKNLRKSNLYQPLPVLETGASREMNSRETCEESFEISRSFGLRALRELKKKKKKEKKISFEPPVRSESRAQQIDECFERHFKFSSSSFSYVFLFFFLLFH